MIEGMTGEIIMWVLVFITGMTIGYVCGKESNK